MYWGPPPRPPDDGAEEPVPVRVLNLGLGAGTAATFIRDRGAVVDVVWACVLVLGRSVVVVSENVLELVV